MPQIYMLSVVLHCTVLWRSYIRYNVYLLMNNNMYLRGLWEEYGDYTYSSTIDLSTQTV